eukprot:scaffold5317_cov160-Amphora_coffeaeformis.AAC.19
MSVLLKWKLQQPLHFTRGWTCGYRNYGKISTRKLIACLVDPGAISVVDRVVTLTGCRGIPSRNQVKVYDATVGTDIVWLTKLRKGPGESPCVMNTCSRLLGEGNKADSLLFFQVLCDTAVELSRLVSQHKANVPEMVAEARTRCERAS